MPQAISNLPVGSLVKDLNSKYLGAAIVWKIADHNHAGYPAGSTTLISDKILTSHLFDAKEVNNSDSNRRQYGNNRYKFSNIRQWLNKSSLPWYIAQHSADAPPTNENGYYPAFGYEEEAGFLSNLSADFINNILETTYSVALASVDGGGTENLTDKIFLASVDEANLGSGGSFPVFTDNTSRIGYYTAEGVAYHNKEISDHSLSLSPITTTTARYWWLRDAYASYSYSARNVSASGALSGSNALSGSYGVRPLCNLNSSILVFATHITGLLIDEIENDPEDSEATLAEQQDEAEPRYKKHKEICSQLNHTYIAKNKDYGNSFGEIFQELGIITAVARIGDKYNRIKTLVKNGKANIKTESIKDTLLDMANYCIMSVLELEEQKA